MKKLISIANWLDNNGFNKEADVIDNIIKMSQDIASGATLAEILREACIIFEAAVPEPKMFISGRDKKCSVTLSNEGSFVSFVIRGHREYPLLYTEGTWQHAFTSTEEMRVLLLRSIQKACQKFQKEEVMDTLELSEPKKIKINLSAGEIYGWQITTNIPFRSPA